MLHFQAQSKSLHFLLIIDSSTALLEYFAISRLFQLMTKRKQTHLY